MRSVRTIHAGDGDSLGSVRRVEWATRLPCRLVIGVEATEVLRLQRLRVRSRGQLQGEGLWPAVMRAGEAGLAGHLGSERSGSCPERRGAEVP